MANSYTRKCRGCGRSIHMRQMPHGQWVAFEANSPHECKREPVTRIGQKPMAKSLVLPGFEDFNVPNSANFKGSKSDNLGKFQGARPSTPAPAEFDAFHLPNIPHHSHHNPPSSDTKPPSVPPVSIAFRELNTAGTPVEPSKSHRWKVLLFFLGIVVLLKLLFLLSR
jgi:hypothetical protein